MAKEITKKRKTPSKGAGNVNSSSKRRAVASDQSKNEQAKIEELEAQISESRKYYNNIATLISMLNVTGNKDAIEQPNLAVAVPLCRVFCRLIAGGNLQMPSKASEQEQIVVRWLKERLQEYQSALLDIIRYADSSSQITALTLSLRLVNVRATHIPEAEVQVWTSGLFQNIFGALIEAEDGQAVRSEFVENFVKEYDDVRFYTFQKIASYSPEVQSSETLERLIWILSQCDSIPQDYKFTKFYGQQPTEKGKSKSPLLSVNSHRRHAQDAWLSILRSSDLSEFQRKSLLKRMSHTIAPWFLRPELLMDFLTDSYNAGGSIALLALSGLFYLIQERNLDYPHFYTKLYSLLDSELLHSKHRSRFFRLLDTFLASTHLPATLVASFIKRLARLALNAPPSAIVAIVPFAYNLLKSHPTCTFMIHREILDKKQKSMIEAQGMTDPFLPDETDPTLTNAIESSLWEIESLQSHYHPNVAAIARIISEQFTKQSYNMEDFLDYSYQGMLMAELGVEEKPFRKAPVVEFQIPKRIFTDRLLMEEDRGEDRGTGSLLRKLWEFPAA
ncbi:ribosome biogenesis protein Noc4, putative [Talaromyces stipitatus ATCC 10500]|uniref:Ribosome biogenesis protein Noc4, putative n=1 Tax=Talaromyces stipitatus (strain ATCC 10500 / CBS 375.48 / QM 6759 / NRRL 1006) TaxID=441959 RepID=B8MQJ4_TALSN|nr:ribosome biogenesis protein Noc4, putative [Talaromyces stipitatus ATCC 10500]EED13396.1 ribosome biogenesis protein Noc4, putative [Talaromyces stipitatus ATCC 10500]